jgi:molybdenum cofactor cytidylyltransferase
MKRMTRNKPKIGAVLLAAGASIRLGQPKQLLNFRGKSLLENVISALDQSEASCLVVVLGGNEALIKDKLNLGQVVIISNPEWQKGMSGSLKSGLTYLKGAYDLDAVLLLLADQPYVDHSLLNQLIGSFKEGNKGIIACSYNNTLGVPCIFSKKYFPMLLALSEQEGAKKIILAHREDTAIVDFPLGAVDIDTWEDYESLLKKE